MRHHTQEYKEVVSTTTLLNIVTSNNKEDMMMMLIPEADMTAEDANTYIYSALGCKYRSMSSQHYTATCRCG